MVLRHIESSATFGCFLPPGLAPELPEKDRPVLASAIQGKCDVLLTGDRTHFGPLYGKKVEGVTIHSPAGLAQHLNDRATERSATPGPPEKSDAPRKGVPEG